MREESIAQLRTRRCTGRLLVGLLVAAAASAGSSPWADETDEKKRTDRPSGYGFVNLGPYDVEDEVGLLEKASYEFQLAGGAGMYFNRFFAGELELGILGRQHRVPESLFPDRPEPTLSIAWLSFSIAARIPVGKFEPFVAAGIGSGQAELTLVSEDEFPSVDLEIDDDRGVLYFYRAGFDAGIGKRRKHRMGLELRRMVFEADLGEITGGEKDIGGTGALFTYRYVF
jgi:hypothetical protein